MTLTKKQNEEILKEAKKAVFFVFDKCFLITWCKDTEEINQYFKDNIDQFIILKKNINNKEYLNKFSKTVLKLYNEEQDKQETDSEEEKNKEKLEKLNKQKRKIRNTILKHHKEERDETEEQEITPKKEDIHEKQILKNELIRNLFFITNDDIIKILIELNFRGTIQKNKILMMEQLLKNFDTMEKMEKLNEKIKSCIKK